MKAYNILVTGCGGDISQSMGKILINYKRAGRILGCDIHNDHAGHFIFDECFIIARADSSLYIESITSLIRKEDIHIVVPATEAELEYLVTNGWRGLENCVVIRPNDLAIEIGLDKFKTVKFLESLELPFPRTVLLEDVGEPEYPCIVKSRRGSGSKAVHLVKDKATFELVSKVVKGAVCQEYLDSVDDEFTCAVFRSKDNILRTILFRRKLIGGYSGFGIVEENAAITEILDRLARAFNLVGSINIQLRINKGVPTIFEINSRFSSTVLFRHMFGFEDLIWAIEDALGFSIPTYQAPTAGGKFYKGFQEYIVKA